MGFGVLIAAVFTQESVLTLVLGLAVVMLLFAGVRLAAWWLEQRERGRG